MVRLSGPGALRIASGHFSGKRSPEETPTHRILHGRFHDGSGAPIDTVLLSVFRAPHSYTGEDVVEIASHGGAAVPAAIFEALVRAGARPARPGEFTERAFRNGKLDLAQAEAVAALVRARSDRAARAARATLGGALSRRIERLDGTLVELLAEVEARIDFPSEAGERLDGAALAGRCGGIASEIGGWLAGSSLLNALVGYERAIVSDTAGTTRDTVEASIWLDGVELRMVDTAGLRWSDDPIERLGTERAALALSRSDLAVVVLDRSAPGASVEALAGALGESAPVLVAWNKADLARSRGAGGAGGVPRPEGWSGTALAGTRVLAEVETVAIEPSGADLLRDALREALPSVLSGHAGDEIPTASARQEALLAEAHAALVRAEAALRADESCDLIALDLTDARRALGEIVGRGVDQDVVAAIFARFCIGK